MFVKLFCVVSELKVDRLTVSILGSGVTVWVKDGQPLSEQLSVVLKRSNEFGKIQDMELEQGGIMHLSTRVSCVLEEGL